MQAGRGPMLVLALLPLGLLLPLLPLLGRVAESRGEVQRGRQGDGQEGRVVVLLVGRLSPAQQQAEEGSRVPAAGGEWARNA